jgi:small-conductance mechanosensitive channel
MANRKEIFTLILLVAWLLVLLSIFARPAYAQTPTGTVDSEAAEPEPSPPAETAESEPAASEESGIPDGVLTTRTPEPTATPGVVSEGVSRIVQETGLAEVSLLGLAAENWINLGISLLIIVAGYLIGTWVIRRLLTRLVRRTPTKFDDRLLAVTGPSIRWLVVLLILKFAVVRLTFIPAEWKTISQDILFVVAVVISFRIIWQLISLSEKWFTEQAAGEDRDQELAPVIKLLVILGRVFMTVIGIAVLLSNFGINVTVLAATLGVGGLALSLAARDIIADILAGITILTDRPFRIGDRIEINAIDTWGDVTDIGLRTTRVRTRDNRMVIVPNSSIAKNEIINYTYPDPRYRIQTHVGVAYGTDVEVARQVIIDAVRQLEDVLPDKPVDALYNEMGDSAMIFRVRWWIESYADTRRVIDRVHTSLQAAFDAKGIETPFPIRDLNLRLKPDAVGQLSEAFKALDQSNSDRR